MARSSPWSVKGVDEDARQIAREAAKRHGLTIGAWVDRAIKTKADNAVSAEPANKSKAKETPDTSTAVAASSEVIDQSASDKPIEERSIDAIGKSFDVEKALKAARGETEDASQIDGAIVSRPPPAKIDPVVAAATTSKGFPFSRVGLLSSAVVAVALGGFWIYDNNINQPSSEPKLITAEKKGSGTTSEPVVKPSTSKSAATDVKDLPAATPPDPATSSTKTAVATAITSSPKPISKATEQEVLAQEAENGNHKAQFELANRYLSGNGVAKDLKKAVTFLGKAADGGIAPAQYNLGLLYETGSGVQKNAGQAFSWYQKAASQGHARAQHNLGTLYAQGKGTPKNYKKAAHWFGKGSENGLADSMYSLGLMHEHGLGVAKSPKMATAFYNKALTAGSAAAAKKLKQTAIASRSTPTPAEIKRAPATAPAAGTPAKSGLNKAEVQDIQRLLSRLDLAPGTPGGVMGQKTIEAIKMYQRFAGLKVDGKATPSLLSDLRQVVGAMAPVEASAPAPGDR